MSIRFIVNNTSDPVTSYHVPDPALAELAESTYSKTHIHPTQPSPGRSTQVGDFYYGRPPLPYTDSAFSSGIGRMGNWTDGGMSCPRNVTNSFPSINADSSLPEVMRTCSKTLVGTYCHSINPCGNTNIDYARQQPSRSRSRQISTANDFRTPVTRPARPSYTEEQRFFIMYHHVIQKLAWNKIEQKYAKFFDQRTVPALTSVYYRIRKAWGMNKVTETAPEDHLNDCGKVNCKASDLSGEFLKQLGYSD
jgi:hypothetical protein